MRRSIVEILIMACPWALGLLAAAVLYHGIAGSESREDLATSVFLATILLVGAARL